MNSIQQSTPRKRMFAATAFRLIMASAVCMAMMAPPLHADKHSAREVAALIKDVESRLNHAIEEGAESYAKEEIAKIDRYVKNAKKYLADKDEDYAFYEITKGKAYFKLLEAKKELLNAETDLTSAKSNL